LPSRVPSGAKLGNRLPNVGLARVVPAKRVARTAASATAVNQESVAQQPRR
jgi:hypothetical protein